MHRGEAYNAMMPAFRGLTADTRPLEKFKARAPKVARSELDAADNSISLHAFAWKEGAQNGCEIGSLNSVDELDSRSEEAVRIMSVFPSAKYSN